MYYIGIDFGHEVTTISKVYRAPIVPGGPDQINISPIAIRDSNNVALQKIITAVCKKDGKWAFVENHEDYKCDDLREGFKGMVKIMSPKAKESMKVFAQLIFNALVEHDTDIIYNSFEDRNFMLGIACPSDWVLIDEDAQKDYLEFFRKVCGLPVDICIKESDAIHANYFKFDTEIGNDENVLFINAGLSTIDFTTYSKSKCIEDLSYRTNTNIIQTLNPEYDISNGIALLTYKFYNSFLSELYRNINDISPYSANYKVIDNAIVAAIKKMVPNLTEIKGVDSEKNIIQRRLILFIDNPEKKFFESIERYALIVLNKYLSVAVNNY